MEDSNIFIREGKENKLIEDLSPDELESWLSCLSTDGLHRTIFVLCCALHNTKTSCRDAIRMLSYYKRFDDLDVRIANTIEILKGDVEEDGI